MASELVASWSCLTSTISTLMAVGVTFSASVSGVGLASWPLTGSATALGASTVMASMSPAALVPHWVSVLPIWLLWVSECETEAED